MIPRDKSQRNSNHRERATEETRALMKILKKKRFTEAMQLGRGLRG